MSTTRRAFLKSAPVAAAAAVVAVPAVADVDDKLTPTLDTLIEAHKAALAAFNAAMDKEQAAAEEYETRFYGGRPYHEEVLPLSIGGGVSLHMDVQGVWPYREAEQCSGLIDEAYEKVLKQQRQLEHLMTPEVRKELRARWLRAKAADKRAMHKMLKAEAKRQEQYGYAEAARARDAASEAEAQAARSVLAYHCRTMAEVKLRAEYVMGSNIADVMHDRDMWPALLWCKTEKADPAA